MTEEESNSPALSHDSTASPRFRQRWILWVAGGIALLGMVTASAIVPLRDKDPVPLQMVLEQLGQPVATLVDIDSNEFLQEERIQRSDTVASLLARLGVTDPKALTFILQNRDAELVARQLRPGKTVTAKTGREGELITLFFPLNAKDAMLVIERTESGFSASEKAIQTTTQTHIKSGEIVSSLFGATDAVGIPDAIAIQLAEVFGSDIDFHRDLRKGDRFSVVYESIMHNGQHLRSGRILAVEFINNKKAYEAFWFQDEGGKGAYYTADGQSLHKAFLRAPLEFSRVSSGFSNARRHPILQKMRAHKGIDYAAPTGTPVRAVADAVVEFVGRQGGYGNLIILKHKSHYSTAYGHLNKFASNIRKGARVNQGETIGFVGQTGLATGPHLHYEFRVKGQQVNPATVALPIANPLEASQLTQFKSATAPLHSYLELTKQMNLATTE